MALVDAELPFTFASTGAGVLTPRIPTLKELMTVPREEIAGRRYDIAAVDLVCAAGLPGTEDLDVGACLTRLDMWTETIRGKTAKYWPTYRNEPARFSHNPNIYRVDFMCHVLGDEYGIRFNPLQENREFWEYSDPDNEFICGQLGEKRIGTCAALSKLCIAVGRRLGYPLRFVQVPEHSFFRWHEVTDRFNNDWNGRSIHHHDDAHYKIWPVRWTEKMERDFEEAGVMLVSMTPERELAMALVSRAIVLIARGEVKRRPEVLDLLAAAIRIDPSHPGYMEERKKFFANLAIQGSARWKFATRPDREEAFVIDGPMINATVTGAPTFSNCLPGWARRMSGQTLMTEPVRELKLPLLHPHLRQRPLPAPVPGLPTMEELLNVDPDEFLRRHPDTAAVNILCASDLPNGEDVDLPRQLAELDEMAEFVRRDTAQNWHAFKQDPGRFHHSEHAFRVMWMMLTLRRQYRLAYNPQRYGGTRFDPADAADNFIHGLLSPRRTGTCASLPVLAVAVGRRLGYPLHLVRVPQHGFFRWDDGTTKINFEFSGDRCSVHPDDYYRSWPIRWNDEMRREEKRGHYLTSLSPKLEVARSLETRAGALEELGRLEEAVLCLSAAERYCPASPLYAKFRTIVQVKWGGAEFGFPFVGLRPSQGFWYRPKVIITELFPEMLRQPKGFFDPVEHVSLIDRVVGMLPHLPICCVVSVGPLFAANWYWNFHRDPAPLRPVEPGRELLDVLDLFRDRRNDPKGLFILISTRGYEIDPPPFLHTLNLIQPKPVLSPSPSQLSSPPVPRRSMSHVPHVGNPVPRNSPHRPPASPLDGPEYWKVH